MEKLKRYAKKSDYTYTLGSFPTFELLEHYPQYLKQVLYSAQTKEEIVDKLRFLCGRQGIPLSCSDRMVERIREKEACLVAGVLQKYPDRMEAEADHVVLVHPKDMGNLGTIIRTCAGFGIHNLALIEPCADVFHPKTLRASMGALFCVHVECFSSFAEYQSTAGRSHDCYPFMLAGSISLQELKREEGAPVSLIFGNESSGLDDSFLQVGQPVCIRHGDEIDSLNLSMAAGIALYEFTRTSFSRQSDRGAGQPDRIRQDG